MLRTYPDNAYGALAVVVDICLNEVDEVDAVAVDLGFFTIGRPRSASTAFTPIPCIACILLADILLIELSRHVFWYRPPFAMSKSNLHDRN